MAIIADGNSRWAHARGLPVARGHEAAADTLKARIADAIELGVAELAVYVFSTENWSRPAAEVGELMEMFSRRLAIETPALHEQDVRIRFIGSRDGVPAAMLEQMDRAQALTGANGGLSLFLALNYGGRAEIVQAARRFTGEGEEEFRRCLYGPDMHDPDVIVRTGSERRISNYLLWQSAYSELVFRDELWPDFDRPAFEASLREFAERTRRFGGRRAQGTQGAQVDEAGLTTLTSDVRAG